jgi:hypothetical protein
VVDGNPAAGPNHSGIDVSVPHSARIWNYWLGGKDNFEIDRRIGEQVREIFPDIVEAARQSRAFLVRSVEFLAGEAGIRQFLDVGTGLPTADNTHEVAQRVAADSHIVYVDNDPLVLAHARALLTSSPVGTTRYVHADLHRPEEIVEGAAETLDFSRPVALMLMGIMGHTPDDDEAHSIVRRLVDALPSGSYLTMSDGTNTDEASVESMRRYAESGAVPYHLREPEQFVRFFDGLEVVEPGVVSLPEWRPRPGDQRSPDVGGLCGVARKP